MMLRRLLPLLVLAFSTLANAQAQTTVPVEEIIQQAERKRLWLHSEWLGLLHYKKDGNGYESYVDSPQFFLAADGKTRPKQELIATLTGLLRRSEKQQENNCRFVARKAWLQRHTDPALWPKLNFDCPEYDTWRKNINADSVTLIFPTYHINSPSSMYGHTLLRIDPPADANHSKYLSAAVNFGAQVDPNDNSFFYALRGLTGGYAGQFGVEPYYEKIKDYNQDENRDIWEYPLNLEPEETDWLVKHLWELRGIDFSYYFFDENCSYRLLELLEIARPGLELTDEFPLVAIPIDTIRAAQNAGLTGPVHYRPSKLAKLQQKLKRIPAQHKHHIDALILDPIGHSQNEEFAAFTQSQKNILARSAFEVLYYREQNKARDPDSAKRRHQLLKLVNQYPSKAQNVEPALAVPDQAHLSRRVGLGLGRAAGKSSLDISLRPAFHSLEDKPNGFPSGAQLNMGSLELQIYDEELDLQALDIIDIRSLSSRGRFIQPWSWQVKLGYENIGLQRQKSAFQLSGGGGVAYEWWPQNLSYGLATLRLEAGNASGELITPALGWQLGSLQHWGTQSSHLQWGWQKFFDGQTRHNIQLRHRYHLNRNQSLGLELDRTKLSTESYTRYTLQFWQHF